MVPVSDAVLCEVYPVKKNTARAQSLLFPDLTWFRRESMSEELDFGYNLEQKRKRARDLGERSS